jgi:sphingosine kinase
LHGSERHLSFLSLSWGLISDVDIESEVIRCVGAARNTIYGLYCIMRLRRYPGVFSYVPVSGPQPHHTSRAALQLTG